MSGTNILKAQIEKDQFSNQYAVFLNFDRKGAKLFSILTKKNIERKLILIFDGKVLIALNIDRENSNGIVYISGYFSKIEAKILAYLIKSEKLNVEFNIIEEKYHQFINKDPRSEP